MSRLIAQLNERVRLWLRKKRDWDACFKPPGSEEVHAAGAGVLKDIGQFAGAYKTTVKHTATGAIDPLAMAEAEGRRAVYLFIQRRLRLTDEQILNMTEKANE